MERGESKITQIKRKLSRRRANSQRKEDIVIDEDFDTQLEQQEKQVVTKFQTFEVCANASRETESTAKQKISNMDELID